MVSSRRKKEPLRTGEGSRSGRERSRGEFWRRIDEPKPASGSAEDANAHAFWPQRFEKLEEWPTRGRSDEHAHLARVEAASVIRRVKGGREGPGEPRKALKPYTYTLARRSREARKPPQSRQSGDCRR